MKSFIRAAKVTRNTKITTLCTYKPRILLNLLHIAFFSIGNAKKENPLWFSRVSVKCY